MRSLNTSRRPPDATGPLRRWLLAACAGLLLASPALPLDPTVGMSRYRRDAWGSGQGYPGGPAYAFAQTSDGYLWIATQRGLIRFDGVSYRMASDAEAPPSLAGPILGLRTDQTGDLWVRLRGSSLVRRHGEEFRDFAPSFPQPEAGITAMGPAKDGGTLLATFVNGVVHMREERFETLIATAGLPNFLVLSIAQTLDGTVWLGTRDSGLFSLRDGHISSVRDGALDRKVNSLLATRGGDLWIGTDNGVARWSGGRVTHEGIPQALKSGQVLSMIEDSGSNIWVATSRGLFRVNADGASLLDGDAQTSPEAVTAVFEDREGSLWIGAASGIERLRDSAFLTYSSPGGPRSSGVGPVLPDTVGRTWFGGRDGGLFSINEGHVQPVTAAALHTDVVYSIASAPDGLWIGRQTGGLTHIVFRGGAFTSQTYTQRDGLAQNSVYSVHRARDGTIWAGTLSGGVSKLSEGRFTTYTIAHGLASNTVVSILESSDGAMWFATPGGLSVLSEGRWQAYTMRDGLPSQNINCLLEDSTGVLWIGTVAGLALYDSGQVRAPTAIPQQLQEQILGIAEDQKGSLWVATTYHVLRVNREKLLRGILEDGDLREYGTTDGLQGVEGVKRHRSVVADPMGRIWFAMNRGLSVVDPARLGGSSAPAIAHVQGILADNDSIEIRTPVRIPGSAQRITFRYAGLSLSAPEGIRFRYKLEGYDHGWSEPTAAREAAYTNLSPRSYRFHVIASNPDGMWNGVEGSVAFHITPLFWQTWWFRVAVVTAFLSLVLAMYRFRVRRMAKQLNVRFEERLAERTRIAQELHDTLLQGFVSASMQLHVAVDRVPDDSPAKKPLGRVIELMGQVIEEGRHAVQGLRSTSNPSLDLAQAFSRIPQELGLGERIDFRVIVEGQPRPLHPVLRDEIYRIGREALVNAFRHSQADRIEMELEYALKRFRFLVRDNGCGIDPNVLRSGRDGHWGLPGMRERAERIGAQLHVWSSAAAGTEVELSAPGQIIFENQPAPGLWNRLARASRRGRATPESNDGLEARTERNQ